MIEPDPPTLLTRVPRFDFDDEEEVEDQATRVKKSSSVASLQMRTPSAHSISSLRVGFPAPQFSPPRQPQRFVPTAPITRPTLVDQPMLTMTAVPAESLVATPVPTLAPTVRRSPSHHAWPKMDMSSLAPMAMPIRPEGFSRSADRTIQLRPKKRSPLTTAFLALCGLLFGGVIAMLAMVPQARTMASTYVDKIVGVRARTQPSVTMPAAAPAPPSATPLPEPRPVPPALLDARPMVESDMSSVTFPESAKKHRIYIDGHLTPMTGEAIKMKCGQHTIRFSGSKTKTIDLPCGRDVVLTD